MVVLDGDTVGDGAVPRSVLGITIPFGDWFA